MADKLVLNTHQIDGVNQIMVERGRITQPTGVTMRRIRETQPFGPGAIAVPRFINVMLDKRAPGLWAGYLAGPKSKLTWLAEQAVRSGAVPIVARTLLKHELLSTIHEKLLVPNRRHKQGVWEMDYMGLFEVINKVTGGNREENDAATIAARIITELLARAYSELNVLVPFVGIFNVREETQLVADCDLLIESATAASISDIFEAMRLGVNLKSTDFNAAAVEALLGPQLVEAARKLLIADKYHRWMHDAARLVGKYIVNEDDDALYRVRDDANMPLLASNASFALGAIAKAHEDILTPSDELKDVLEDAVMRIRQHPRFEMVTVEKFAEMFSHYIIKDRVGHVAGVYVTRNLGFKHESQTQQYIETVGAYRQAGTDMEHFVRPISEAMNTAYAGTKVTDTALVIAQHWIASQQENNPDFMGRGGFYVGFGVTELELTFYAHALAKDLLVSRFSADLPYEVYYNVADSKGFYEPQGIIDGSIIYTTDPAEAAILLGRDKLGTQPFPRRPQIIPEEMRGALLDKIDDAGNFVDLGTEMKLRVPVPGMDARLEAQVSWTSLAQVNDTYIRHYQTVDHFAQNQITDLFALGIVTYSYLTDLRGTSESIEGMLAQQVANALHAFMSQVANTPALIALASTVRRRFLATYAKGETDDEKAIAYALRGATYDAAYKMEIITQVITFVYLQMGLLTFGVHEDLIKIFQDVRVMERLATNEMFTRALSAR